MSKSAAKPAEKAEEVIKPTVGESVRETIDSIVIAFVLAFLFRTFEAEAFVIPTGSMALTLMGDHKDLVCSECAYPYRASASSESQQNNAQDQAAFNANPGAWRHIHTVVSSVCPNCRYRMKYDPEVTEESAPPSYKGDRILVTKYSYEFADPARWDVAVFKNPSQAKINYIKRVVGLPNEEVMIYRGDIYVRKPDEQKFRIARKSHDKAAAMAQTVYDNDFIVPTMHERGWPQRWVSEATAAAPLWKQSEDLKSFRLEAAQADDAWLRYQHYVPMTADWETLQKQSLDPQQRAALKPQLISDFCEYNTERIRPRHRGDLEFDISYLGLHWVGDIAVECELQFLGDAGSPDAQAVLEIVEGRHNYQCRLQPATGDVVLSISGLDGYAPTAKKAFSGNGPHKVRFANVDDQLLVWIDGRPVTFEGGTNFLTVGRVAVTVDGAPAERACDGDTKFPPLDNLTPTKQDVASPIGVAAKNTGLAVSHLKVLRDTYYVSDSSMARSEWIPPESMNPVRDYRADVFSQFALEREKRSLGPAFAGRGSWNESLLAAFLSDIDTYPERFRQSMPVTFNMQAEQFFVLGDNSPRSLDGRLWNHDESYVVRDLLIGKALFVYWPHALDKIPGTNIPFPFFPNFGQMRMIR